MSKNNNIVGESLSNNPLQPVTLGENSGKNLNTFELKKPDNIETKDENIEPKKYSLFQKFLAEFFGSVMLVYHCCGAAVFQSDKLYVGVFSSAFCVLFLIYCFVNISGAHFNPAVSLPLYLNGSITLKEFILYFIAQLIGSFLGCVFIALSRKGRFEELNATEIKDYLIHVNGGTDIDAWCYISCFFTEFFSTFMLDFFVLAISEKNNKLGTSLGLAFAGILICLIFTACNISGSSFNPTRSLAPAVLQAISGGSKKPLEQIWIFIIAPFLGGFVSFYAWKIFKI